MSALLSTLCLVFVGVLCVVGVFHPLYKDTLLERCGLAAIGTWALTRVPVEAQSVNILPLDLALHLGLAMLAGGMAAAKWRARHRIAATLRAPQGRAGR